MSPKTRLQISIVALVAFVVVALSAVHLHGLIGSRFSDSIDLATFSTNEVEQYLLELVNAGVPDLEERPIELGEIEHAWTEIVEHDSGLISILQGQLATSRAIAEVMITAVDGRIVAANLEDKQGQRHQVVPPVSDFQGRGFLTKLRELLAANQDYEVTKTLGIGDDPVFTVRVIVSTVLMRDDILAGLEGLGAVSLTAILASLVLAFVVSRIMSRPLEHIGNLVDRISRGESLIAQGSLEGGKEIQAVESKLGLLGDQYRGAQADVDELRQHVDGLLDRMEEAVFLFGKDDKLVMAGSAAERLLGRGRWELMGLSVESIFPIATDLGGLIQGALAVRQSITDQRIEFQPEDRDPLQLLVNIEMQEGFPSHDYVGMLVRLRDSDPRRELESQLDISTRLAAISRLTSGAAHEIKNPLNSIALHVEVLKAKLASAKVGSEEIEVISREIRRLDRVVKSFLDFTRPVELQLLTLNLAAMLGEAASLVAVDAGTRGVDIVLEHPDGEALVRADRDLLQQALLNVVLNGVQAMPDGGVLRLGLKDRGSRWLVRVADEGVGIPEEAREQIYQLYFTTKQKGSGIGLAMAFRVVQLHGGTIEFDSEPGIGTEFRIELPAIRRPAVEEHEAEDELPAEQLPGEQMDAPLLPDIREGT